MTYTRRSTCIEELYTAYCTRASEQGPNADSMTRGPVMRNSRCAQRLAKLLGFANTVVSLASKMAESTEQVLTFPA
jgi:oligopeptidase A